MLDGLNVAADRLEDFRGFFFTQGVAVDTAAGAAAFAFGHEAEGWSGEHYEQKH
jgi:hypothetical protein